MRYFLRSRIPVPGRILLVESGSRHTLEKAHARMLEIFPGAQFHLCTCFAGVPQSGAFERLFRVTEAPGLLDKLRMALHMRRARPAIAAMLFTGESILLPWKLLLLAIVPAKVLVVNENGDFFWLDWANRGTLRQFLGSRAGVDGSELVRVVYRAAFFPIAFLLLCISALAAYLTRWARLLYWSLSGRGNL